MIRVCPGLPAAPGPASGRGPTGRRTRAAAPWPGQLAVTRLDRDRASDGPTRRDSEPRVRAAARLRLSLAASAPAGGPEVSLSPWQ